VAVLGLPGFEPGLCALSKLSPKLFAKQKANAFFAKQKKTAFRKRPYLSFCSNGRIQAMLE